MARQVRASTPVSAAGFTGIAPLPLIRFGEIESRNTGSIAAILQPRPDGISARLRVHTSGALASLPVTGWGQGQPKKEHP